MKTIPPPVATDCISSSYFHFYGHALSAALAGTVNLPYRFYHAYFCKSHPTARRIRTCRLVVCPPLKANITIALLLFSLFARAQPRPGFSIQNNSSYLIEILWSANGSTQDYSYKVPPGCCTTKAERSPVEAIQTKVNTNIKRGGAIITK
jgi:hypothetical protein